ncbi:hypothetical protein [Phaeobacter sp.]|uniref:hypothetical protein n=1 Tax=Phaeobacter sp. TaxID=1902409 RepID=UPI0025DE3A95|nr:hypothetical protein [Phaeobacter sp.]
MMHSSVDEFLANAPQTVKTGPLALVFVEDNIEVATTLRHHLQQGFQTVVALMPDDFALPYDIETQVHRVSHPKTDRRQVTETLNKVIEASTPGCWVYYCFNAEYLFFPFCETRSIGDMLRFHTEERRKSMLTYVIDLYAQDLGDHPNGVSLETAHLDKSGYFAQARIAPETGHPLERQLEFYGGIRWRYEEHIPEFSRRIDRVSLFRTKQGLKHLEDHRFNLEEYNTYACPWHNNLTAAICSFRTTKALKRNPGSSFEIPSFYWQNSIAFQWNSRQLMDLGLIEPGQWF